MSHDLHLILNGVRIIDFELIVIGFLLGIHMLRHWERK